MGSIQVINSSSELIIRDPGYSWAAWIFWAVGALSAMSALALVAAGLWARSMAENVSGAATLILSSVGVFAVVLLVITLIFGALGMRLRKSDSAATFDSTRGTVTISGGYFRDAKAFRLNQVRQARVITEGYANSVGIEVEDVGLVRITGSSSRGGMQLAADAVNRFLRK